MATVSFTQPIRLAEYGCLTALGDAASTYQSLCRGQRALQLGSPLGPDGGELVPLALLPGRTLEETAPPNWLPAVERLLTPVLDRPWGGERYPVFVTSSNFGVGSLYAFRRTQDTAHLAYGTPSGCVEWLRRVLGWGDQVTTFSHACVSAHLGMLQASRTLAAGLADEALVFSFDFLSPFVAGGFQALKILNANLPAPYADRPSGSIGLGDGTAYLVLTRDRGELQISAQSLHNEMHHFTANEPQGSGFDACIRTVATESAGRKLWLKGHGTGTLEAGRLESSSLGRAFPGAPLVSWKGSIGHTLGSCGAVELTLAAEALRGGITPGTIGSAPPAFTAEVAFEAFDNRGHDGVVCASNAFGGAHAALLLHPV